MHQSDDASRGYLLRHSTTTTRFAIGGARSTTGTRRIVLPGVIEWDPFGLAAAAAAAAAADNLATGARPHDGVSIDSLIADLQVAVDGLADVVDGLSGRS